MINSKKGSELTLNVIIIAVLAVLVLVVLVLIFTGKIGMFASSTGCVGSGGRCLQSVENVASSVVSVNNMADAQKACPLPSIVKKDKSCETPGWCCYTNS